MMALDAESGRYVTISIEIQWKNKGHPSHLVLLSYLMFFIFGHQLITQPPGQQQESALLRPGSHTYSNHITDR